MDRFVVPQQKTNGQKKPPPNSAGFFWYLVEIVVVRSLRSRAPRPPEKGIPNLLTARGWFSFLTATKRKLSSH